MSNYAVCHTWTAPSPLAEAMWLPSGNHTTANTESVWVRKIWTLLCGWALWECVIWQSLCPRQWHICCPPSGSHPCLASLTKSGQSSFWRISVRVALSLNHKVSCGPFLEYLAHFHKNWRTTGRGYGSKRTGYGSKLVFWPFLSVFDNITPYHWPFYC